MTAEVAVTFPAVVLALAVVLFAGSVAQAGVSCADAARAAGREVARGGSAAAATAAAQQVAGRPVQLQLAGGGGGAGGGAAGGLVVVTARVEARPGVVPSWGEMSGWSLPVTCRARAHREPAA
ncbi:hypothetical protein [Aquipuribacter hungaricus]|uniref:TadE-like protein n=2 Tax=Aquipuribacter hungaricus TaxID=545624 RepID=A0ABV7WJA5_9MICO